VDPGIFDNLEGLAGLYLRRYENKPEFDESFFRIDPV
jgi:hypothetical protein